MPERKPAKVAAKPAGFRSITPNIAVTDVAYAVDFYSRVFQAAEIERVLEPGSQDPLYARLKIGDSNLILSRKSPGLPSLVCGLSLHLYTETLDEIWALARDYGCRVVEPLHDTYWGDRLGVVSDPFGLQWSLGKRVERLTPEEKVQRLNRLYDAATGIDAEPVAGEELSPA